jgi:hypothetical protein
LIQVESGALLFAGETQGRRVAAVTFDLHDSDLPLQTPFPILMANLLDYLAPRRAFEAPFGLQPGESLSISPPPGVSAVVIVSPQGKTYSLPLTDAPLLFTHTDELGVYAVNYLREAETVSDYFTVNLFDEIESDIQPIGSLLIGAVPVPTIAAESGEFELWPWLALFALGILLLEWWVYHRQRTVKPSWRNAIKTILPRSKPRRFVKADSRAPR